MSEKGTEGKRPVFLNARQIAERYGVSKQWAYQSEELKPLRHQFGKYVRWKLEDLEKLEGEAHERAQILAKFKRWEDEKRAEQIKFLIK